MRRRSDSPGQRNRRALVANPVRLALLSSKPTAACDLLSLRIRELLAVHDFANGGAQLQAWHDLHSMAKVAAALGASGLCSEALPLSHAVTVALEGAWRDAGPMQLDAPMLDLVRELLAVHDAQRDTVSRAEYWRAMLTAQPCIAGPHHPAVARGRALRPTVRNQSA